MILTSRPLFTILTSHNVCHMSPCSYRIISSCIHNKLLSKDPDQYTCKVFPLYDKETTYNSLSKVCYRESLISHSFASVGSSSVDVPLKQVLLTDDDIQVPVNGSRNESISKTFNLSLISQQQTASSPSLNYQKVHNLSTLLCSANKNEEGSSQSDEDGLPSETVLTKVYETVTSDIRSILVKSLTLKLYHPQIVLENNIKNKRTVGLQLYLAETLKLKFYSHFKFVHVQVDIIKATMHVEEGTIKIRWRIIGVSFGKAFLNFLNVNYWFRKTLKNYGSTWNDGFSTFYVNQDGIVFKHVIDNMMPDDEVDSKKGSTIANLLGYAPKTSNTTLSSVKNSATHVKDERGETTHLIAAS